MKFATPIDEVRWVCMVMYLIIGSMSMSMLLISLAIRPLRKWTRLTFFALMCLHCSIRAWLFAVNSKFFLEQMKDYGIYRMVTLDLLPEVVFLLCYVLLLCAWIEIQRSSWKLVPYSHTYTVVYFVASTVVVVSSAVIFVSVIWHQVPENKHHSWSYYTNNVVKKEGNFITTWSGVILGLFVMCGIWTWRKLRNPFQVTDMSSLKRTVVFLSIGCTLCFGYRAVYVHFLDDKVQKDRLNGDISPRTYAWIFFAYFLISEMLFHVLVLVSFGLPMMLRVLQMRSRRRKANAMRQERTVWNEHFYEMGQDAAARDQQRRGRELNEPFLVVNQ